MFKQSPSRNHRSKGIKVKHVLQICLLIAVCFWLWYQVKHSHEKKKEFDSNDAKIAAGVERGDGVIRFGRKDLPRVEIATKDEKHAEVEEENEGEEEENKHDEDEQEREVRKAEGREEEEEDVSSRGGGDDEIDEREPEENEVEPEREEEFIDEDKEREEEDDVKSYENEDIGKEDGTENVNIQEDLDHDAGSRNTHEAREEHYKADDASSEVAHYMQTVSLEPVNTTNEHTNENLEVSDSGGDNETNTSDGTSVDKSASGLQLIREGKVAEHEGSSNATAIEEHKYATSNSTKLEGSSLVNSTTLSESDHLSQDKNNPAALDVKDASVLMSDRTQTAFNLTQIQNATLEGTAADRGHTLQTNVSELTNSSQLASEKNQLEIITSSNSSQYVNLTTGEPLNSSDSTTAEKVKDTSGHLKEDNTDESRIEDVEHGDTVGENQSSRSYSTNENGDVVLSDPIDASDSSIARLEKESLLDTNTLPEIKDEVHSTEDAAAE
ncbi:hypothetical protein Ancab_017572 [Ancistrocladus abbreviatus]